MSDHLEPPEGYTAEEWAGMVRASKALEIPYKPSPVPHYARDLGVTIPEVKQEFRPGTFGGKPNVRVPNKTYVITCLQYVKIGITADIHLRLRSLEATNPFPLHVVALFAGGRPLEASLHKRFAEFRHRDEWFRLEGAIASWIKEGCPL